MPEVRLLDADAWYAKVAGWEKQLRMVDSGDYRTRCQIADEVQEEMKGLLADRDVVTAEMKIEHASDSLVEMTAKSLDDDQSAKLTEIVHMGRQAVTTLTPTLLAFRDTCLVAVFEEPPRWFVEPTPFGRRVSAARVGPTCRRCTECEGEEHHWSLEILNEAGDGFVCKHCPTESDGVDCERCGDIVPAMAAKHNKDGSWLCGECAEGPLSAAAPGAS